MKQLVCIVCPKGCRLQVDEATDYTVSGNGCPRGVKYGKNECRCPRRVLTTTVRIGGADYRRCPVKTDKPIPKDLLQKAMLLLDTVELQSPVTVGQVVVADLFGSGANIVVTRSM